MNHVSIKMDKPIEIIESTEINPLISKCVVKVCYVGEQANRNRSIITKEVAQEMAPTLRGCPVVGFYNENEDDFEEHNRIIDISNGKFQIKDTTRPYGFVSTDAKVWFQWFEDDGVPHEYLMTEAYIWTGQYPESQRVIDRGNNQSMELDEETLNAHWSKDSNGKPEFFIINEAIMSKLCILGEDVEPCFEGASITKFAFEDDFKQKMFSMITQMQEILEKGGTPVFNRYAVEIGDSLWSSLYDYIWQSWHDVDYCCKYNIEGIYEEDSQKFVILQDRKTNKYYQLNFSIDNENGLVISEGLEEVVKTFTPSEEPQFAAEAYNNFEQTYAQKKKEEAEKEQEDKPEEDKEEDKPEEDSDSEEENKKDDEEDKKKKKYNLEEVEEYIALQKDYENLQTQFSALETERDELKSTNESLTAQINELTNFKLEIEREKKQELIKSFYMLSDELKADCIENIDSYSYDEIESKLSVICVRNKVSFDLDQPGQDQVTTFNLNGVEESEDATLPGWVKRVKEVAKEMNI